MNTADREKRMQWKVANMSATPSSTRQQVSPGTLPFIIDYLAAIDLKGLGKITSPEYFAAWKDARTHELVTQIFRNGNFGGARKVLAIFLKEVNHNVALHDSIAPQIRPHLEVPLDGNVAEGLRNDWSAMGKHGCPAWPGIKYLTPEKVRAFQAMAREIAADRDVDPVDLDLFYWRSKS